MPLKMESLTLCLFLLVIVSTIPIALSDHQYSDPLKITASTSKNSYYIRETVNIQGNLSQNGSPISDGLVAISIRDPSGIPIAFRTAPTGEIPSNWPINFLGLYPCDSEGNVKKSFVVKQTLWINFTVKNYDDLAHYILVTLTLFDANAIPLGVWYPWFGTLDPRASKGPILFMATTIPAWAQPGNATICANILSGFPKDGGTPYCPEKTVNFEIKRNPEITYSTPPLSTPPTVDGTYASVFKLSPESKPGDYTLYVSASGGAATVKNATIFSVESAPTPPQASFTYSPLEPYVNMTITFDASASTAEGYNDAIVKYEWDFGDGTPKVVETTPTTTHVFTQVATYVVTLNVTDSEGLWSTTSKPVTILPPVGPTADFIWYPSTPLVNQTVTFDATSSSPGWNGTAHPPIVNYEWDFGDENVTSGNYPTITHIYAAEGNYTATLTITDSEGLKDNITQVVMVRLSALVGDINGDGVVDIFDAIILSTAFGSTPGQPNWDPRADLDASEEIDIYDAIILSTHFGETIT